MSLTKTEIIRRAAFAIGQTYVTSNVDDDTSTLASTLRMAYDSALDIALSLYAPWNIFKRYEQLSQVTDEPLPWNWAYLYQIPTQSTQIITITPVTNYDIFGDKIATNISPAHILYTFKPEPYQMPPHFYTYLIYEIAVTLGPALAKNEGLFKDAERKRDMYLGNAQAKDAQQQTQKILYDSPIINSRYSTYGGVYYRG